MKTRLAMLYLRFALGTAFLSAVADRFSLWGRHSAWGDFSHFIHYTGQVLSFLPKSSIPYFAWAATIAEIGLGIALVLGLWLRWTALGSALLLLLFAIAMSISFGVNVPLGYSVFSASAGALLLAFCTVPKSSGK